MIQIGKWELPVELFERYLRLVKSTERSSERYNYEFDEQRKTVHNEILNRVGLMVHTKEYREFQHNLQDLCEKMLPDRFPSQTITKLNTPMGLKK